MRVVLASGSSRRRRLLEALGLAVEVVPSGLPEVRREGESVSAMVERLAREKAFAVQGGRVPVIAADTLVVLDGEPLGKPADDADAMRMLRALSGRVHCVLTGYCVRLGERCRTGVVSSKVVFRTLTAAEVRGYVATGEPRDKAGAYGVQEGGGALVDSVQGSYTNVVGLPVTEVLAAMHDLLQNERTPNSHDRD